MEKAKYVYSNDGEILTINGRAFTRNAQGRKVDEDGFMTSSSTINEVCVSVKNMGDWVGVRDTKDPTKTTLKFDHAEWEAFTKGVKAGEFDY